MAVNSRLFHRSENTLMDILARRKESVGRLSNDADRQCQRIEQRLDEDG